MAYFISPTSSFSPPPPSLPPQAARPQERGERRQGKAPRLTEERGRVASAGHDWERECGAKEGPFQQCRCLHNESLAWYLPNTYLPQGIWGRAPFAPKNKQCLSSSYLVATQRVGFEYTFLSCSSISPPCGSTVKPVCLSSLEVQKWGAVRHSTLSTFPPSPG